MHGVRRLHTSTRDLAISLSLAWKPLRLTWLSLGCRLCCGSTLNTRHVVFELGSTMCRHAGVESVSWYLLGDTLERWQHVAVLSIGGYAHARSSVAAVVSHDFRPDSEWLRLTVSTSRICETEFSQRKAHCKGPPINLLQYPGSHPLKFNWKASTGFLGAVHRAGSARPE